MIGGSLQHRAKYPPQLSPTVPQKLGEMGAISLMFTSPRNDSQVLEDNLSGS